jgi:hypothetical protein
LRICAGAALSVGGADGGVDVERVAPQVVDHLERLLALGERAAAEAGERRVVADAALVERVEEVVADAPARVAEVGGAEQRQDQVGPVADAPAAERLAEVLVVRLVAERGGGVEQAATPSVVLIMNRASVVPARSRSPLQQVVGEGDGRAEVGEEVADGAAHRLGAT